MISGSDPNKVENDRAFVNGIYNRTTFTLNVSNSYIGVHGPCTVRAESTGGGNVCNGSSIPNHNDSSLPDYTKALTYDFVAPRDIDEPDFHLKSTSVLIEQSDANGGGRLSSEQLAGIAGFRNKGV